MRLGIDLGGTNLAYGVINENGKIVKQGSVALTDRSPSPVVEHMHEIYETVSKLYDITFVGVGVPGLVDQREGVVIKLVNLNWTMVPLVSFLSEVIPVPIMVANDANAACIGEVMFGGLKGHSDAILLTLGTGLGAGVITGDKLLIGHKGAGSEIGHMVIGSHQRNCNCGRNGCFETFVSATALINAYNDMLPGETVRSAKEVFDMMKSGDLNATVVVERFCEHFADGIVNLYNIFAPEVIALGGGVAQAFPLFIDKLNEAVSKRLFTNDLEYGKIVAAELGNDAGIIGAAYLDQF